MSGVEDIDNFILRDGNGNPVVSPEVPVEELLRAAEGYQDALPPFRFTSEELEFIDMRDGIWEQGIAALGQPPELFIRGFCGDSDCPYCGPDGYSPNYPGTVGLEL